MLHAATVFWRFFKLSAFAVHIAWAAKDDPDTIIVVQSRENPAWSTSTSSETSNHLTIVDGNISLGSS